MRKIIAGILVLLVVWTSCQSHKNGVASIPEEPDYLQNVDVELPEIEPDTGFITDVYNALPSGIVSMIAVGLGLGVVMKIIS